MDIQKYVSTKEDGSIEIDKDSFQRELDAEISKAVEKFKNGKGREEIRKQLEEEAKLTAEEKLKKEREEFEQYKMQSTIQLNQAKAKAKMEGKGFTEKELDFILSTVSADEKASLSKIDELIAERQSVIANTQKIALENLQQGQQKTSTIVVNPDNSNSQQQTGWTKSEILQAYKTNI